MSRARGLRENRDFLLFWTGDAASEVGTRAATIAYPLLVLAITGSPAMAGALGFARTLPWFLFALPAGAIVDRIDRKAVMIACDTAAFAAMASIAAALAAGALTLAHLFAAVFVEGVAFIFLQTAYAGTLKQLVRPEDLSDAVAYSSGRASAASLVGPPVGGMLFAVGRSLPFFANAVSYFFSLASLLMIKVPFQRVRTTPAHAMRSEVRDGLAWLWRQPFLRTSLLLVGGSNFFTNAVVFTLIVVARAEGASAGAIGAMLGIVSAFGVLGALSAPRLRRQVSSRTIVVGYFWIALATIAPLVVASHPVAFAAILGPVFFFGPTWDAVVVGYRIRTVPDELQGRVASADMLLSYAAIPLAPLVAGMLVETVGGDATLIALGGWMLAIAVVGTLSRSLRVSMEPTTADVL